MSPIATTHIYAKDANGVDRLVAAPGDEIPQTIAVWTPIVTSPPAAPLVTDLPIPDYDDLDEAALVAQLEALSDEDLAAVRAYEQAHRARGSITRYRLDTVPIDLPRQRANVEPAPIPTQEGGGSTAPLEGYDDMTVGQVQAELQDASEAVVKAVKAYEADHQARKGVLGFERPES